MPGVFTREFFLVLVQGGLLVSRTLLTDYISRVEGYCGSALTSLVSTAAGDSTLHGQTTQCSCTTRGCGCQTKLQ